MTPQEIFDYKLSWKPGVSVRLHSDLADRGKTWCRRNLETQRWSFTTWTNVYEHTFHFETQKDADTFEAEFGEYANQPYL